MSILDLRLTLLDSVFIFALESDSLGWNADKKSRKKFAHVSCVSFTGERGKSGSHDNRPYATEEEGQTIDDPSPAKFGER